MLAGNKWNMLVFFVVDPAGESLALWILSDSVPTRVSRIQITDQDNIARLGDEKVSVILPDRHHHHHH